MRRKNTRMDAHDRKRPREPMPEFVNAALEERHMMEDYRRRPAYQQNDDIRWIVGARRHATQYQRLRQMLDELEIGGIDMKMAHAPSKK